MIAEPAVLQVLSGHRAGLGQRDDQVFVQPGLFAAQVVGVKRGAGQCVCEHVQQNGEPGGERRAGDHQPLGVHRGVEMATDVGEVGVHLLPVPSGGAVQNGGRQQFGPGAVHRR